MALIKPVPIREHRLGSCIAQGDTCGCLNQQVKGKCLKKAARAFNQATVCQEWYSMFTLLTVQNTVAIVHAPVGCAASGACMNIFNRCGQVVRGQQRIYNARWYATNLRETDIVHGGEQKLRETVKAADARYHPEAIFIFTSCASGIIGDPVANIVNELQDEVQARLVLSQCEGFRSSVWATGFDAAFHGISEYLLEPRAEKEPDLVNVISPLTVGRLDEVELERLLGELGLRANFIPCYSSIEQLRKTVSAAATTATCLAYGDYFARTLTERYGVPHTRELMPVGLEGTDRWLRALAALLGKERATEALIEREHQRVAAPLAELRRVLQGKRVFVSAGQARAMTFSLLAQELGFELVGTTVYHYDEVIAESINRLAAQSGGAQINVANIQHFETANALARLKPDLYVADDMTTCWGAKQGFPTVPIYDYGMTYLGYSGLLAIGTRFANALANPSFAVKLARHQALPYRAAWYEQNPFKYILSGAQA
ncbi:MAG: nitrogen fixation protein NifE [bacterium]|nr:nitrogen fixation protein NifE [bacterium]